MPNLNKLREDKLRADQLKDKQDTSPLHKKNKHKGAYDFPELIKSHPELKKHCIVNQYGTETINFSDAKAVKNLNTALLKHFYNIEFWGIPENYLCPPIPGRADYIHYAAELLGSRNNYKIPMNGKVNCLDVGTGANCIYPIVGHQEYGWHFIASEIDEPALNSAKNIVKNNACFEDHIDFRFQTKKEKIFKGIIKKEDQIDITICNPPFHKSAKEAAMNNRRKNNNLKNKNSKSLNFGGTNNELWCEGGEKVFINSMIEESAEFKASCYWFTTLVSKKENLKGIYQTLKSVNVSQVKTIHMGQGNKRSR